MLWAVVVDLVVVSLTASAVGAAISSTVLFSPLLKAAPLMQIETVLYLMEFLFFITIVLQSGET